MVPQYVGTTPERLDENPFGLQWPVSPDGKETKILHKDKFSRGSGKFYPVEWEGLAESTDKEYPFVLTTGGLYYHWCSGAMTMVSNILYREAPEPFVEINIEDAKSLNIRNGQYVEVITRYGKILVKAKVTDSIRRGALFIPFHYKNAIVNSIIGFYRDPYSKIPEYKVVAAKIEVT